MAEDDDAQGKFDFDAQPTPPTPPEPPQRKPRRKGRRPLLDLDGARAATADAIHRATFLTSPERKQEMFEAIETAARTHAYFIADAIWVVLGEVGDTECDNGSGLGPVLKMAVNAGVITYTSYTGRSRRPVSHRKLLPFWKSLYWKSPLQAEAGTVSLTEIFKALWKMDQDRVCGLGIWVLRKRRQPVDRREEDATD